MDLFFNQVFTFTKFTIIVLFLLMDIRICAYYTFFCIGKVLILLDVVLWIMLK